jgi:phosphoketolase
VPGVVHEGGEPGYALVTAFDVAFEDPGPPVVRVIGAGEVETGPARAACALNA